MNFNTSSIFRRKGLLGFALLMALGTLLFLHSPALAAPGESPAVPTDTTALPSSIGDVLFIPPAGLISTQVYTTPLPTGAITIISGPIDCSGQSCYEVKVFCSSLFRALNAFVKIGEPDVGAPLLGTILFANGGTGTAFWESTGVESARVLSELRTAGYRTVQIRWKSNWYQGAAGKGEGLVKLACRPATLARWVYDTIQGADPTSPYCAYGHSNGASEIGYMITQYGLGSNLSLALMNGGPNWVRNDIGCIQDDPAYQSLWFDVGGRKNVDRSFGYPTDGTGPCTLMNPAYRDQFYHSGLVSDEWQYVYPNTMLAFLYGSNDRTITANHSKEFYNTVLQSGSPWVQYEVVPGVGHNTFITPTGANRIRDILLAECTLR